MDPFAFLSTTMHQWFLLLFSYIYFFAKRILVLKETPNSTKHLNKNKNYNEILEIPFVFNLHTVSTERRRCRSSLSRPDVVDCGREVAERFYKTTSVNIFLMDFSTKRFSRSESCKYFGIVVN